MPATATSQTWYRFENAAPAQQVADVFIIDAIGGWGGDMFGEGLTAKSFIDDLVDLPASIKTIRLHVNSPGGDVFAALNIANALRDQRLSKNRTVDVIIEGIAASSASIVIMAGSSISIADNALVMIHNPYAAQIGDAKDMRAMADRLDKVRNTIIATYKWRTSMKDDDISALMDATTWMDADEAIANGFATKKIKGLKAAASFDPAALAKLAIPDKYAARFTGLIKNELAGVSATSPTHLSAGVSAPTRIASARAQDRNMKVAISDQIKNYEASLFAKNQLMDALLEKSGETGSTLDDVQQEEYDGLEKEVEAISAHLTRLRAAELRAKNSAVPVAGKTPAEASESRNSRIVVLKNELPKGTRFTRVVMALAAGKGSLSDAMAYAKRWETQTPEVLDFIIKNAAAPGTASSASPGWGSELVYETNLASEFVELLRPATIIGRIQGIRMVPFNVRIPVQTGGSTVNWVGEAAPKPVSELAFDTISLGHNKIAGIVVLTEELVRLSSPSAEATVRRDLVEQIAQFKDAQFITPSVTAGANNPASITNGVSAITASGVDADAFYSDLNQALATFDGTDMGTNSVVLIMPPALARGISALRNALGQFEFTGVSMNGGTIMGFPVIVSNSVPAGTLVVFKADELFMADDGQVSLDASKEATLDMNGGSTPNFNLWQKNCVGIRAELWVTWAKRRADAVAVITSAAYGPAVGSP